MRKCLRIPKAVEWLLIPSKAEKIYAVKEARI